jgi:hypothetical protein
VQVIESNSPEVVVRIQPVLVCVRIWLDCDQPIRIAAPVLATGLRAFVLVQRATSEEKRTVLYEQSQECARGNATLFRLQTQCDGGVVARLIFKREKPRPPDLPPRQQ